MPDGYALITGANGYVGGLLARRYLDRTDRALVLCARDAPGAGSEPPARASAGRVRHLVADLSTPAAFAGVDQQLRDRIVEIVHCAALTRFDLEAAPAQRVNVHGTEQVLRLATRCPNLESLGLVSTVYSSGLRAGRILEQAHDGTAGFANLYEWSKWAAEELLLSRYAGLPARILRLATVIADDDTGTVTQQNAFHTTLKLYFHGLLSLIPGRPSTPLYFVTGDFVARAVLELTDPRRPNGIYHVTHGRGDSLTLDEAISVAFEVFGSVEEFRRKRILRPLTVDRESFEVLAAGMTSLSGGLVGRALSSVAPFARQLYVTKELDNTQLRAALRAYSAPDPELLVRRTCESLVRTRWGRHPVAA
jgi:nucleoside-diphosphate-sugar epimerase